MAFAGGIAVFSLLAAAGVPAGAQECPTEWPLETPLQPPVAAAAANASAPLVAEIGFAGNQAVSAERLRDAMATRRERAGRQEEASQYDPARWSEDHRRLCAVLRDVGYVAASVGPPQVAEAAAGAGAARRVVLTIPVREGPRHRFGELTFEGLTVVDAADARARFDVEPGETYRHQGIVEGLQALRQPYARRGYAEWAATVSLRPDPQRQVVDAVIRVSEGLPRFVGRITFSGHRGTLDETLRREVLLDEGELLDTDRLGTSVQRIEALGYVTVRGVRLAASERNPQALDVAFEVEPRPILRYSLAGGVSALEGVSLTGMLGTVNAFGRGERLYGSAQVGEQILAFELSASRPHALGPWSLGAQARKDRLDYDAVAGALAAYTRDESALRVQAQRALGGRTDVWLGYGFTDVSLEVEEGVAAPAGFGERQQNELSGTLRFDGWDHPWKPRRGYRTTTWAGWSAGTLDYLRARTRSFALAPLGRRAAVGAGFELGGLHGLGDETLPFDERYLLGGETDLRGFEARSVGPTDDTGTLVGGTRYAVATAEAHLDVTRGLRALAFVDAGRVWDAALPSNWAVSTGIEARFAVPVFRLPVRLIAAWNPKRESFHPEWKLRVAIGPM